MRTCAEPLGRAGGACMYDASGTEPFPELCYYHAKKRAGLTACTRSKGCALPETHRGECSPRTVATVPGSADGDEDGWMAAHTVVTQEAQEIRRVIGLERLADRVDTKARELGAEDVEAAAITSRITGPRR